MLSNSIRSIIKFGKIRSWNFDHDQTFYGHDHIKYKTSLASVILEQNWLLPKVSDFHLFYEFDFWSRYPKMKSFLSQTITDILIKFSDQWSLGCTQRSKLDWKHNLYLGINTIKKSFFQRSIIKPVLIKGFKLNWKLLWKQWGKEYREGCVSKIISLPSFSPLPDLMNDTSWLWSNIQQLHKNV